jgi:hypothetical protein
MATQPSRPRPARPHPPSPPGGPAETSLPGYATKALLLWPGLDRTRLAETKGDPRRIARLVSRRTNLPPEAILRMLEVRPEIDLGRDPGREDGGPDRL